MKKFLITMGLLSMVASTAFASGHYIVIVEYTKKSGDVETWRCDYWNSQGYTSLTQAKNTCLMEADMGTATTRSSDLRIRSAREE